MQKSVIFSLILILSNAICLAQSVGIGTTTPDGSSLLELKSSSKGFLPPRMTAAEKMLVQNPKQGLLIYQTDAPAGLYVYNGTAWTSVAGSSSVIGGWSLTGNPGTNPATSFIGTTDNQPLKFRVNNIGAGEINHLTGNVAFGAYSLPANTMSYENTALGTNSLNKNTSGSNNLAAGAGTLFNNTTGNDNVALGFTAMVSNQIGHRNVAAGMQALYSNISGSANIVVGNNASFKSIDAGNIVAIGDSSLFHNLMSYNVGIGSKALFSNTTGVSNTAIGSQTLSNNNTGSQNTAVGRIALFSNQTGIQNTALGFSAARYNQGGNGNTALGFQSLLFNENNNNNTAIGHIALASNTADNNTGIGKSALNDNSFGTANTAVGVDALATNTTGNYNTAIGYRANTWGTGFTNATAIGANAQAGCSDCVVLGSITGYNGGTANSKVGIGITSPQKTLHINPNGAGGMMIGNNMNSGGYTILDMGISQASGGYSYIQSTGSSGSSNGGLALNRNGGFVSVGTPTPLAALHVKQYADANFAIDAGLRLERHDNTSHWDIAVDYGSNLSFSFNGIEKLWIDEQDGDITTVSDRRMKKDIRPIETVLPSIMKLQAKSYRYKDNEVGSRLSYGFIAQEVEKIFPDVVSTKGPDNFKAIGYQKINIMAIKAIQEQQLIIEGQQKEVDELKQQNRVMMESIQKLQKAIEEMKYAK